MKPNRQQAQTQRCAVVIHADRFQPFTSRIGLDHVVRLQFDYDIELVMRLKAILTVYAGMAGGKPVGGWLPKFGCWFVELNAWEAVKLELRFLGHGIIEKHP